jgi:hypothetical protein
MASFNEHCSDSKEILGQEYPEVHIFLDSYFSKYGPLHRFVYHHSRGIKDVKEKFGDIAEKAAIIHILKDCGRIPSARDWSEMKVDSLGILVNSSFNGYWNQEHFLKEARKVLNERYSINNS